MKHISVEELKPVAKVVASPLVSRADVRRGRLERFAALLDAYIAPVRPFSQLEALTERELRSLRSDSSPLSVAFSDPVLRSQGLESDAYLDAVAFFDLSAREAHHLLCDCHYPTRRPAAQLIATRARSLAAHSRRAVFWMTLGEKIQKVFNFLPRAGIRIA